MSDERLRAIYELVREWGRWGTDDQRGALNRLTPERVAAAILEVRTGEVISCAHDIGTVPTIEDPQPAQHMMLIAGDHPEAIGIPGYQETMDFLGIACHGMGVTHIDALCHTAVDGRMYNDADLREVKSTGAWRNGLGAAGPVVGRGVLLDVPAARGVDWIDPPAELGPDDLDAAVDAQGTELRPGDVVYVCTGRDERRDRLGPWNPFAPGLVGMGPECIVWFHEREIALLGTDAISDPLPPRQSAAWPFPIHQICISAMGVHLIDNMHLAPLARACRREGRWSFLTTVLPLRLPRATGCPVNPVAVL